MIVAAIAALLIAPASSASGREPGDEPSSTGQDGASLRPTEINPAIPPYAFAETPVIRMSVGHDDAFLESAIRFGHGGRVVTDLMQGKRVIVRAGTPAYAVPMTSGVVWCAVPLPIKKNLENVCISNDRATGSRTLITTGLYVNMAQQPLTGGKIVPDNFSLGEPIRVSYYVTNLGKIPRFIGRIAVGSVTINTWGIQFGDIFRPKSASEKLLTVGKGLLGISPDPAKKGRYIVRVITAPRDGETPLLDEVRNDPAP